MFLAWHTDQWVVITAVDGEFFQTGESWYHMSAFTMTKGVNE